MTSKTADLAGPGIGNYDELEKLLPTDYTSLLTPRETMEALFAAKAYIEEQPVQASSTCFMVQVPLIVDVEERRQRHARPRRLAHARRVPHPQRRHQPDRRPGRAGGDQVEARRRCASSGASVGEGICTDMRAVRKDYFLDHDHSAYVDQWDWERVITADDRNLDVPHRRRDAASGRCCTAPTATSRSCSRSSHDDRYPPISGRARRSSTPRRSSRCTRTCPASSGRPRSSRTTRRSSSTASAGRSPTATRTSCAPPTTTTG